MRSLRLSVSLVLSAVPAVAQTKALLFTGRFPFISLDSANERAGGSINRLEEFDLSLVTPNATSSFAARTFWHTSTALQTLAGDAYNDNNYTRFYNYKTYFERWNIAAPFVKFADQADCTPEKVFVTVRDDGVNKNFTLKTNNGTGTVVVQPGDFFRIDKNGNVEFFITQALIMQAAGPQPGTFRPGASAICQDSVGNLYYSPAERGHAVTGYDPVTQTWGTPVFHNDASIMMIRRPDITYDARGNVSALVANSAFCIFSETSPGPSGQPTVRSMMANAGALSITGAPISTSNNMVGLALDPNGGTVTASLPWGNARTFEVVPNFVWTDDGGSFGSTMFSTRVNPANNNPGSVAVINGVQMGSTTVPATGAYWGVQQDTANFQPTTMGFAVIDAPANEPVLADSPRHGAILTTDANLEWDFYAGLGVFVVAVLSTGPVGAGQVPFGFDVSFFFPSNSYTTLFGATSQFAAINLGVTTPGGYATLAIPRPSQGRLTGLSLIVHGVKLTGTTVHLTNPVISQFK